MASGHEGWSITILLHPETRTSLRAAVWRELWEPQEWSTFRKLQSKTTETGDAKLLALLSLLSRDNADRARLSNEAIAKDASLTWLDDRYFRPADTVEERASAIERIQRLEKWDADNAVPRLFGGAGIRGHRCGVACGFISCISARKP